MPGGGAGRREKKRDTGLLRFSTFCYHPAMTANSTHQCPPSQVPTSAHPPQYPPVHTVARPHTADGVRDCGSQAASQEGGATTVTGPHHSTRLETLGFLCPAQGVHLGNYWAQRCHLNLRGHGWERRSTAHLWCVESDVYVPRGGRRVRATWRQTCTCHVKADVHVREWV